MRGYDHDGIVTHGRSREFRMHMKNPAQTRSGCIRFNDLQEIQRYKLYLKSEYKVQHNEQKYKKMKIFDLRMS